jgi:phage shock protein E
MKSVNKEKMGKLVEKGAFLVDMRSPVDYRDSHVSGAVNLPLRNFLNKIMGMPKTTTIVAYSTSLGDPDLTQGMNYAEVIGFTNLYGGEFKQLKD